MKHSNIKIPSKLDSDLAEVCGIHIGDGHLGWRKHKHEYLIPWSVNLTDDKEYFDFHVKDLWKKVFNIDLDFRSKSDNVYELRVYSKKLALFFNEFLELPFGSKTEKIRIPSIVKEASDNIRIACLRGIIDTDFYLIKDRKYVELGAWFASKVLILDLYDEFKKLGFLPTIRTDVRYYNSSAKKMLIRHQIRIRKKVDVQRWFELIGTNNPKIYKRYLGFIGLCPGGVDGR